MGTLMPKEPLKIGFVSPGPATWPHYESFTKLLPADVTLDFHGLQLYGASLEEIAGKKSEILRRVDELARRHEWSAAIVIGAPTEVFNPGLLDALVSELEIPVTTALGASVAALRAYEVKRLLLLTPFAEKLNRLIGDYLTDAAFEVTAPHPFAALQDAGRLEPEQVYALANRTFKDATNVDAVYFQGAVLDPLKILDRLESDLKTTVIASNPAMLWHILSLLNRSYVIPGYGKLLFQWPRLRA